MKIRIGFVSNSSSSSFIITNDHVYNEKSKDWKVFRMQDFLDDVKNECRKYKENQVKYAKRAVQRWNKNPSKEQVQQHRDYMLDKFSEENLDKFIKIFPMHMAKDYLDMDYWYSGSAQNCGLYVVCDTTDNYIPEKVLYKLFKKYNIPEYRYCTHMG